MLEVMKRREIVLNETQERQVKDTCLIVIGSVTTGISLTIVANAEVRVA